MGARAEPPRRCDRLDGARLDSIVGELSLVLRRAHHASNAEVVVAGVRRRFLTELAHSELSVTGMSPDDRARKKILATGRRELEHEFGKVMRYRSIRDLASGAPGAVVAAAAAGLADEPVVGVGHLPLDTRRSTS